MVSHVFVTLFHYLYFMCQTVSHSVMSLSISLFVLHVSNSQSFSHVFVYFTICTSCVKQSVIQSIDIIANIYGQSCLCLFHYLYFTCQTVSYSVMSLSISLFVLHVSNSQSFSHVFVYFTICTSRVKQSVIQSCLCLFHYLYFTCQTVSHSVMSLSISLFVLHVSNSQSFSP